VACSRGAAGEELGASLIDRNQVNTGTIPDSPSLYRNPMVWRVGPLPTGRCGVGRRRRSTPRTGKADYMGKDGSKSSSGRTVMSGDAPVNIGALLSVPFTAGQRVLGMQMKLHRWATADSGRRFDDLHNSSMIRRFWCARGSG
jgi:hypothetical protein